MKITFKGREIEVEQVAEGLVKKSDTVFYVKDNVTGEWLYCSDKRLDKLVAKFGSQTEVGAKYTGRTGKRQSKAE
jgi:hypothetical protein